MIRESPLPQGEGGAKHRVRGTARNYFSCGTPHPPPDGRHPLPSGEDIFRKRCVMIPSTQVTFRNMTAIDDVRKTIESRIQRLESVCKPILRCRVRVEAPAKHHRKGDPFNVQIDTTLTDGRIVVKHSESMYAGKRDGDTTSERNCMMLAVRGAFSAARRKLQEHARLRRADVKTHEPSLTATVNRVFPKEGYGYLETPDGREIYFHENSVLGSPFKKLKAGAMVQFAEESGLKGPQASTVRIIGKLRAEPKSPKRRFE
jgi:cold shock CspA family protein